MTAPNQPAAHGPGTLPPDEKWEPSVTLGHVAQPAATDVAALVVKLTASIFAHWKINGSKEAWPGEWDRLERQKANNIINAKDILTPALSRLVAERDAARLELARVKASDDFNWKIIRDCMDELEMKDMGPSMMRGEIQEWKLQVGYLKEKEVRATDRAVMLKLEVDRLTAERDAVVKALNEIAKIIGISYAIGDRLAKKDGWIKAILYKVQKTHLGRVDEKIATLTAALSTAREREGKLREALKDARHIILTNLDAAQLRKCSEDFAHVKDALETQ